MMNIILFDENRNALLPFTYIRPIAEIRWGILTITEKWKTVSSNVSWLTADYLSQKYPAKYAFENIYINARFLPDEELVQEIEKLNIDESIVTDENQIIAIKSSENLHLLELKVEKIKKVTLKTTELKNRWDLFIDNEREIKRDFKTLTENKSSEKINDTNTLIGNNIFLEKGAKVEAAILNSSTGPIYIGKDAEVMEGSVIRGPFALCEAATVKMAAKIYGATTIGPHSKVGGEINNSIILGYSNKGHDGFLGNSVIGEWCNLGADTNVSNLKNDYGNVSVWDYEKKALINSCQQFCGLIMGDHSKSGINTMFNTGTVVGVSANVFGADFPDKHIASFSWGGGNNWSTYRFDKAIQVAERVMQRRNAALDEMEIAILKNVFDQSSIYRK